MLLPQAHRLGKYEAAVGHDVLIEGVVGADDSHDGVAFGEAHRGVFLTSDAEVHVEVLDLVMIAFDKPVKFLGGVGEGGEYALRWGGIVTFDDECAVDYGLHFHGLHFLQPFRGD